MGISHKCIFHIRIRYLVLSLLLFLSPTFAQERFFPQDGPNFASSPSEVLIVEEEKVIERALIGSTPPRCEGKCNSCSHCEAIQVPIVPQQGFPRGHFVHSTHTIAYSRGDSLSNYKPMGWKCKCGNSVFNP